MQYIALAISKMEVLTSFTELQLTAEKFDLKLIKQDDSDIDSEVRGGILSFTELYNLFVLKFVKYSIKLNKFEQITSSEVSTNLVDFYLGKSSSNLIDFLLLSKDYLPKEYFLIFAFEWDKNEKVRFEEFNLNQLREYFSTHNSWYFWLFDYLHDQFTPDLDVPLIIKVLND